MAERKRVKELSARPRSPLQLSPGCACQTYEAPAPQAAHLTCSALDWDAPTSPASRAGPLKMQLTARSKLDLTEGVHEYCRMRCTLCCTPYKPQSIISGLKSVYV